MARGFISPLLVGVFLIGCSAWGSASPSRAEPSPTSAVVGANLRARFPLTSANQKLVDNRGNGFEDLYGTRNVRAVLNGVYYRGGANNAYHRTNKRDNQNPLPNDGLENLCEEGFGRAFYLYSQRFQTAPALTRCRDRAGHESQLNYSQVSALSNNPGDMRLLIGTIYEHVRNPRLGAIYDHCWNGWHASGLVAANTLRQFCGFTAEQAISYWNQNTDGNSGPSYNHVRTRIRNFEPYPEYQLTAEEKAALCPNPETLQF